LWTPNILVLNSADDELSVIKPFNDMMYLHHSGLVILKTPVFLETTCSLDLSRYPFDTQ
ncbi:Neuronal acetylcholine receptor subunit alpha-4, partial [Biomphalaria glabrata]